MQWREMPGDKADGAEMAVQPRRTRTRWQSRDCGAVRGLNGCDASSAAKRADACAPFGFGFAESTLRFASAHFPAFSADSQALNTAHLENRLFQLPKGENQCLSLYLSGANAFCHSKNG